MEMKINQIGDDKFEMIFSPLFLNFDKDMCILKDCTDLYFDEANEKVHISIRKYGSTINLNRDQVSILSGAKCGTYSECDDFLELYEEAVKFFINVVLVRELEILRGMQIQDEIRNREKKVNALRDKANKINLFHIIWSH